MVILIAGVPRSGKSTLADRLSAELGVDVVRTDDWAGVCSWEEVPHRVLERVAGLESYVLEGVQVGRVIRWAHRLGRPLRPDAVHFLDVPRTRLSRGQESMAKGVRTVWREASAILRDQGVEVTGWRGP